MSEFRGAYAMLGSEYQSRCKCGEVLGIIKVIDGLEVLYIGNVMVRSISANCSKCGHEYYYDLNGKRLERLIKRLTEGK